MRNYSIDTLKLICAILVISLHVPLPEGSIDYLTPIMRCAVPVFFMLSGYFTYSKSGLNNVIRKRIMKQVKVLCWAFLLYLFISFVDVGAEAIRGLKVLFSPRCFLCNILPYAGHLWYISAYIYVLIIILFIDKYNLYKLLFYITPVLLIVAISIGMYSEIFLNCTFPTYYSRNFLFTGLPFFALGMMIRLLKKIPSTPILIVSLITFYFLGLAEVMKLKNGAGDMYFSTIFISVSIFLLFLSICQPKDNIFSRLGREDGLYIYILHQCFATIVWTYSDKVPALTYISMPLVLCLTLLLIYFLKRIKLIGKII